jgi:Na+/serine symporter
MYAGNHYILVTDSPYFYLSLVLMLLGSQLFLAGFVGELVVRNSTRRNDYEIEDELNIEK